MKIKCMVLGGVATNCYFIINEETKECLVVDPADKPKTIMKKADDGRLSIKAVLLTHGHGDHIMGVECIRDTLHIPVYANRLETELLADPKLNLSTMLFRISVSIKPDVPLDDGDTVREAGMEFTMLSPPGHTPGGCCYYNEEASVLFSGDTLFCGSVGRTDFPGGSMSVLVRSINDKIMPLPDGTDVFPGHGETTTIGWERVNNPYLSGSD